MTVEEVIRNPNIPILYKNVMPMLPSDFARDVFLWAVEQDCVDPHAYAAEKFALEVDTLFNLLGPLLKYAGQQHGREDYDPDLMNYILERHANKVFGGNKKFNPIDSE